MPRGQADLNPRTLAARVTAVDRAPANGSSIAFLLEHAGASVLLAADAFPTVLEPALQALARHRSEPGPLKFDAIKLSHHGSRANVTVDLLKAAQAKDYVISTSGAIFRHPDDEAISRVILHGGDQPRLWFNYDNERSRKWTDQTLRTEFAYEVLLPQENASGVTLLLGSKR